MASADPPRRSAPWLGGVDPTDLALRLTLLTLLLRPVGAWSVRPLILALAALGLAVPRVLRRPELWAALAMLTGLRVVSDWTLADNHAYLLAYWCIAVTLALGAHDVAGCLALNARLLIGWAFAFAVLWKVALSPDYLDGRFFRVIMLTDARFAEFARLAGGLAADQFANLQASVQEQPLESAGAVVEPARFLAVARIATLWTIAIEGAVALACLSPLGRGLSRFRDALLLCFCMTTYAVATVAGFGWLLLSMGMAQCDPQRRRTQLAYLAAYAVVIAYHELPLAQWALGWLDSAR